MANRKRGPGCCCDCPYGCTVMHDDFGDAAINANWSQIRGTWEETAGLLRVPDDNAQIIWYGEPRNCDTNMVVIAQSVDLTNDGNTIYIIINYGSGTAPALTGFLFAKIVRHATNNFDISIGELATDGGTENILDSITGATTFSQYVKLCYHTGLGKLSLVTTVGAAAVLEATPTIAVTGRRAGIASGTVTTGHVQVGDFAVYKRDEALCQECGQCIDCTLCDGGEGPTQFKVVLSGIAAGACPYCDLNGTYFLDCVGATGDGHCSWQYTFDETLTHESCTGGFTYLIEVRIGGVDDLSTAGKIAVIIRWDGYGPNDVPLEATVWQSDLGASVPCTTLVDESLTYNGDVGSGRIGEDILCDFSAATCLVSAV